MTDAYKNDYPDSEITENEKGTPPDFDRRYLTITEVAKYRKMPSDTLRYYDRIGLVKPNFVDKTNGRRYYSMEQCEHLGTIKELRKLNLSLQEIEEFMNGRSFEKSERVLSRHLAVLKKEIEDKKRLYSILEEKLEFMAHIRSADFSVDKPVIKDIPERYVLRGKNGGLSTNKTAIEFMKLEESLEMESPILATNKAAMEINDSITDSELKADICPMLFCSGEHSEKKNFSVIKGGKYICAYHTDSRSYLGEIIAKMKYSADEAGYVMGNKGILIYQVDITLTDDPNETVIELQYPVFPKQ
ncbi:MAG: MerR family transcriptional regulator [Oscillospiraceae bacterium]|nr:MerR family transcriptional regulator [Oscillospiraceae bacterium]